MPESDSLSGDVAIVTGAGQNIGQEIAERFAAAGAKVGVADIDEERTESTVESVESAGGDAISIQVDVSDEDDVIEMVERTEDAFGPVTILVNGAAITERTGMFDLDMDEFDRIVAVNMRGPFLCTREAAKSMRKADRGGRIVNFASTSAHVARPRGITYAMTKKAMLSFTKSTANALAEDDIRVNIISPTRTGSKVGSSEERSGPADSDILRGRWGRPEDQANVAMFLVSDESDFITGTEIIVDGGAMAAGYQTDMEKKWEEWDQEG